MSKFTVSRWIQEQIEVEADDEEAALEVAQQTEDWRVTSECYEAVSHG